VSFPKARKGAAVVKPVKIPITLGYVDELMGAVMQLRLEMPSYKIAKAESCKVCQPQPLPVASGFTKPNKAEAVAAHRSRFSKSITAAIPSEP
jgi:hypothetical protein